jgi:16S rRNA (uracil1498-N3)-methyltransferase
MPLHGPHFLIGPADHDGQSATVRGDDARHLATVLRARPGEAVSLADGTGALYEGRVAAVSSSAVRVAITGSTTVPPPRPRVTVVHALPKGRKLDDVVQRLTELGVDRIVPVHSVRSQVRLEPVKAQRAVARWRAVALAAAKQSRRARLLEVAEVGEWGDAFDGRPGVVLWEESSIPLRDALPATPPDELVVAVGPEGGLTAEEVTASRLPHATLGPTILRTETAALVAVSAVLYATGRLG